MSFPLDKFEPHISRVILDRGLGYFQENCVDGLTCDGRRWEADVYGSETYLVEIEVEKGEVKEWYCDCPYDQGPICKHVVAVLFAIREEVMDDAGPGVVEEEPTAPRKRGRRPKTAAPKTAPPPEPVKKTRPAKEADPTPGIIEGMNEEELRAALAFLSSRHKEVKAYLLSKYPGKYAGSSRALYQQMVGALIRSHRGRHGYIDYELTGRLGHELSKMMENAGLQSPLSKAQLLEEVVRQVAAVLEDADDSDGDLGTVIENALEELLQLASDPGAAAETLDNLFRFGIEEGAKEVYYHFGSWGGDLLEISCAALRGKDRAEEMIKKLDGQIAVSDRSSFGSYFQQRLEKLKLELIGKWRSQKEADAYLQTRLHYANFRRVALERALAEKRYEEARRLATEGIGFDTKNKYPGLVAEWRKWLVRIAEAAGDRQSQIAELEKLYLDRGETEYFRQLKKIIPKGAFKEKAEQYIRHFRLREKPFGKTGQVFNSFVAHIFVEEKRLEDLLAEIRKQPSLFLLDQYYDLLSGSYPDFFIESYEKYVRQEMDRAFNRRDYERCCGYVVKIRNLGGTQQAQKILSDWRAQYPRRTAMLEEIRRMERPDRRLP